MPENHLLSWRRSRASILSSMTRGSSSARTGRASRRRPAPRGHGPRWKRPVRSRRPVSHLRAADRGRPVDPGAPFLEDRLQHVGPIGHDSVDAEVSSRCIWAASLTVHTCTWRSRRCAAARNRRVTMVTGPNFTGTCTHAAENRRPGTPAGEHQPPDLARAHGGADPVAEGRPDAGQSVRGTHPRTRSMLPVRRMSSMSGSTAASCFGSMLTRTSGQAVRTSSSRDLADPALAAPDLGPRQVADGAGAVGQAVEGVVVEGDEDAVGGGMRIGLQVAVAEARRRPRTTPWCSRHWRGRSGRPGA